ncbi:hypothetical protein P9112_011153 [Eukaryota sp. TZLM1-RC]
MQSRLNYNDAQILAPMVRVTTLPFRLTCYDYECDIGYSEELIDHGLLKCQRVDIDDYTIYKQPNGKPVFTTVRSEKDKLVVQIGSKDGARAAKGLLPIADTFSEVNLNLGCPAPPNIKSGIGCALASKPEAAADVIKTLNRALNMPVSAKIRIQGTRQETQTLVDNLIKAGVCCLTVHGRTQEQKGRDKADWEEIGFALEIAQRAGIPTVANGSIASQEDVVKVKEVTKAEGVMIGRAAMMNCSVFRREGLVDEVDVTKRFLQHAEDSKNKEATRSASHKYILTHLMSTHKKVIQRVQAAKTFDEISSVLNGV